MPAALLQTLNDERFQITENASEARIFWLIGAQRGTYKLQVEAAEGFLNEFPNDDVLLQKDLLVPLIHSSYKSFEKSSDQSENPALIPESYMANTQLPAFAGRWYELSEAM